jgi:DNA-directed RNA polymerase specialized sigma24 family protein
MAEPPDFSYLALAGVSRRCTQESDLFFKRQDNDPRFCFELFRRAICERHAGAWELVYRQYAPLVGRWVQRHSLFTALDEEVDYFVSGAFQKMWIVLTPEKFAQFPDLKSVLRYLQMCVHSVLVDHMRRQERASLLDDEVEEATPSGAPLPEEEVLDRVAQSELWQQLVQRLKDDKERQVVYGTFVLALKPRDIYEQYSQTFASVNEVYRIKENLIARLRRDADLQRFVQHA